MLHFLKSISKRNYKKYLLWTGAAVVIVLMLIPPRLFKEPYSTVITDREGALMGVQLAADGQWRFPEADSVPQKFKEALLSFEDQYFFYHPGFNPMAMAQALIDNVKAGKVVRGGSTITMQVVRLSRKGQKRTFFEKGIELFLAMKLELHYSKAEILQMYAAHAPFGGNTVGLQAACWRYYNRPASELSWAEAATLAVLPNAPALIFPGKNEPILKKKRNRLLQRLYLSQKIDSTTWMLAMEEPLPLAPYPFPVLAKHLLQRVQKEGYQGKTVRTTLKAELQEKVIEVLERHHQALQGNQVHNGAVVVLETQSGNTLAYAGNTEAKKGEDHGNDVDVITSPRSTGSILKPFLYAAMLNEGRILPQTLVPDVPFYLKGFNPQNFNKTYEGAAPADKALARSLNVPYVYLLQEYGVEKYHYLLKKTGMKTLHQPPGHYGLSLVLGGAEGTLWDICGMYASMGRALLNYYPLRQNYDKNNYRAPVYIPVQELEKPELENTSLFKVAAIWHTFEALKEVNRPETEGAWKQFSSSRSIAWKTGTSYGFRDGWAVGVTPDYVVGVWVGNADGEGRPGLTGLEAAAPVLFDVFSLLPPTRWFREPAEEMSQIAVCQQSGQRAAELCPNKVDKAVPVAGLKTLACSYHQLVHLDRSGSYRVTSQCEPVELMQHVPWFVLPPVMEWFFKDKNASYQSLPPFKAGCEPYITQNMQLIYPAKASRILVPRELDGKPGETVFEVAHRQSDATLYWHLDEQYMGSTRDVHQMGLNPAIGKHLLLVTDENGESLEHYFEVIGRN